ncbi:periplasmic heavy metal sensor [Parvularcula sp. IMCC14364]|uniref:periplasmic heavy metal sensor n=1 Tax=Parvularcula sp. IMCC14364 TaxID=3067902 RepID=UPI0027428C57|nr:periplasmic heavy metal sensor [Parvularcula sp. IMCC14364]
MRNLLLLASLAINIFIVGLFIGDKIGNGAERRGPEGQRPPSAAQWAVAGSNDILPIRSLETLPPDLRQQARRTIRDSLPESRRMQQEIARLRGKVGDALRQPELDTEQFAQAVDALQRKQFEQQQLTAATIQKVLTDLPDAERIALLKRIEEYRQKQRLEHQEKRQRVGERMRERARERMQQQENAPSDEEE